MIIDENQRRTEDEVEQRLRAEFAKAIGSERGAVVWPQDTNEVRDRLAEFQIVYLPPSWLDTYPDQDGENEKQKQGMRLYIEQCGNGPRRYRNGLSLAIPDSHKIEVIRNAVRLILTLELLQSQSKQRQLTPQQEAELTERKRNAENELKGGISLLYAYVYTPQNSEQVGQNYTFDKLQVQSYSQAPQVHSRVKEALSNRVVWDSVQPSKLAKLTQLNELQPLEKQYYAVVALVACFFSYYNFTHIWDEKVIRQAIIVGVKNRTFAYVANAHKDNHENLLLGSPASTSVYFGKDIPAHEIDMGDGAFLLSATYAQQLLAPPVPAKVETPAHTDIPAFEYDSQKTRSGSPSEANRPIVHDEPSTLLSSSQPVAPGQGGQHYRLRLHTKSEDVFEVMKALQNLGGLIESMQIAIVATTICAQEPRHAHASHRVDADCHCRHRQTRPALHSKQDTQPGSRAYDRGKQRTGVRRTGPGITKRPRP